VTATAKEFTGIYRNKQHHEADFDAVLDRALAAGVEKVMLTGMSLSDVAFNRDIAHSRRSQCSITVGVHPYHAKEADDAGEAYFQDLAQTINNINNEEPGIITAFGELGLDYDHLTQAPKDAQIRTFKRQLDLIVSEGWQLPMFLHCRAAYDDFVTILTPYLNQLPKRGLVHSFVGTVKQMQNLVDLGLDVSVNGFSFKDRESLEMVRQIPLTSLQIETDAPWGTIQPSSEVAKAYLANTTPLPAAKKKDKFELGKMVKDRNESCTMEQVAFIIAGLKEISVEEVTKHSWENSTRMFGL
jgi:TatD DNase family protein